MHLVTISVRLWLSEFTGNTLALCPMQTQLFLKSSCPLISYFNPLPTLSDQRETDNMESSPAVAGDTSCTVNTQAQEHTSTLTCPHSTFKRWRKWEMFTAIKKTPYVTWLKKKQTKAHFFVEEMERKAAARHTHKVFGWMLDGSEACQMQSLEENRHFYQLYTPTLHTNSFCYRCDSIIWNFLHQYA